MRGILRTRGFLLVPLCLIGAAAYCIVLAFEDSPDALLVADPAVCKLGSVNQGEQLVAKFTLRNVSDLPISIVRVHTNCSCTASEMKNRDLPVGDSVPFSVNVDTSGLRGKLNVKAAIAYRLRANPDPEYLSVGITGRVIPQFDFSPPEIFFSEANKEAQIVLKPVAMTDPLKIERVYTSAKSVSISEKFKRGKSWVITIRCDDPQLITELEKGCVFVETNSSVQPSVIVPFHFSPE